jgi:hypothetical protein
MKTLAIILALALTGCASTDYDAYAKAQGEIARAKSEADTARYSALSKIAEGGTDSARIAAVMALALGGGSQSQPVQAVQAPAASQALQWASILVPSITTLASINANMRIGLANADNSARIAESTNSTFLGVASKIQAPAAAAANITTTTNTTTTSTDNHSSTVDNHAVSTASTATTSTSTPTTTTTTLSGTGTLGSGAYSTQANPVTTTTTSNPVTTTTTNPATTGVVCGVSVAGTVNCIP